MESYSNNESRTLNEVHVACPKAPCTTPPCMFHHRISHQPSSSPPKLEDNIAIFHSILNEAHVAHRKAPPTLPHRASSATAPPQSTAFNLRPPPLKPQAYAHVRRIVLRACGSRGYRGTPCPTHAN